MLNDNIKGGKPPMPPPDEHEMPQAINIKILVEKPPSPPVTDGTEKPA